MARITTTAIAVCLALSGCGHPADEWTSPPDTGRTVPVTNDFEPAAPLDEPGVVPAVNIEPPTGETDDDNDIDSDATDNIVDGDTPEAATCPLEGAVFHVDASAEGGDGTSWDRAMVRLQDAVDAAAVRALSCGTVSRVRVREGTYAIFEDHPDNALVLRAGVVLMGGFAGDETDDAQRNSLLHPTILDGRGQDGARVRHVVIGADDAVLDGFTVTGGSADGDGSSACGGGLFNRDASTLVRHCSFIANASTGCGGAVYNAGGAPRFEHTRFEGNISEEDGGAAFNEATIARFDDCTFIDNVAQNFGGGAITLQGDVDFVDCAFADNTARGGGALAGGDSVVSIRDSGFTANNAHFGGAIFDQNPLSFSAEDCTFTDNYAQEQGASAFLVDGDNDGSTTVSSCLFEGGAPQEIDVLDVFDGSSEPLITDCTFQ